MRFAFVGAEKGLSARQFHALRTALQKLPARTVVRMLDFEIGAGEMAWYLGMSLGLDVQIALSMDSLLESCDVLIACPSGPESPRSPTWQGVARAREARKRIRIIHLDGAIARET